MDQQSCILVNSSYCLNVVRGTDRNSWWLKTGLIIIILLINFIFIIINVKCHLNKNADHTVCTALIQGRINSHNVW